MTANELLEKILTILNHHEKALFSFEEVTAWPSNVFSTFVTSGLLECASPATSAICDGCEQNCIMPVEVWPTLNNRPARAFIACDQSDDMGCISIDPDRLKQWQVTTENLIKNIAELLSIKTMPHKQHTQNNWLIGVLKGVYKKDTLIFDSGKDTCILRCAGHNIDVIDVLSFNKKKLQINKYKLLHLIDSPIGSNETPEERRTRLKKRVIEEKNKGNPAFNKTVAEEEKISIARLQQIVKKNL